MKRTKKNTSKPTTQEAEVEELLKAVEEEMALNLSLNSHMSRIAPDYLRSDLDQRFRALKKPQPQPSSSSSPIPRPPLAGDPELDDVLGGYLAARVAALRASLPAKVTTPDPAAGWDEREEEKEEDEDDQVERLIRWAKDAARRDPSPPSDDDDHDEDDDARPVK